MNGTELADFLRDTATLCRSAAPAEAAVLYLCSDWTQTFFGCGTMRDAQAAAFLCREAERYGVSDAVRSAAVRAWTDRFGQGDSDGSFDRHPVSQGRW